MTAPSRTDAAEPTDSAPADLSSVYLFSLPKAGSMLLQWVARAMAAEVGVRFRSVMGELFAAGVDPFESKPDLSGEFEPRGWCYGGFRELPGWFRIPGLADHRKILLVRDPRDMLVSNYFSVGRSHPAPGQGAMRDRYDRQRAAAQSQSIDDYVLGLAGRYAARFESYQPLLDCPKADENLRIDRYEDILWEKRAWVRDLAGFFGWGLSPTATDRIADKHDLRPDAEQPDKHVRQAEPGDHRRKLRPETIAELDRVLEQPLRRFGYLAP